ncbi:cyclin-like protein [Radiomyces spectabilis]|uniref:cyclin-like protein n=1 Tax=Radiomyces spectabilis TaxID=64574 RepID=UPI00221FAE69|nr:cyclin-like protein [Radiomyces spectabilis]KAI8370472.1 cyclin-like protein [Radiomyces spectabilis]
MATVEEKTKSKPPVYQESSQYRHWRFSPEQIWDIRRSRTTSAVDRVRKNVQEDMVTNQRHVPENTQYLTVDEEMALCRFYEKQLQGICKHLKFTEMVMATAVIYMKRFFLYNTAMDYHPKDVLLTCLFLATKSESERISIDEFGKSLQLPSTKSILNLEFTVSQGLKFEYYVHHPYRPAYGFFLDMQAMDKKLLKETYAKVPGVIGDMLLTDLPLIYQPSQLGLAAFLIAGKDNGFATQVQSYIEKRFPQNTKDLLDIAEKVAETIQKTMAVTPEQAKEIDYRLRICTNPAKNPESAL